MQEAIHSRNLDTTQRSKLQENFPRRTDLILPFVVIFCICSGWFAALQYKKVLEEAVVSSYQETQLEVVRAVARSTRIFVEDRLEHGHDIQSLEQDIFKRFVAPIHLLEQGDAWIYAPDHIVFDLSSDFPEEYRGKSMAEIFSLQKKKGASHYETMTDDVSHAREGKGWYVWLPEKGREIGAWTPVRFGSHTWTIGLSTPLKEILRATGAERQSRFILTMMTIATVFGLLLSFIAVRTMIQRQQLDEKLQRSHAELEQLVNDLQGEIEKRRRTEEAVQEVNTRLNTLIEAIPDIIYFKDLHFRNLVVNRAFESFAGLEKDKILEKTDEAYLPADLAATCRRSDEQVIINQQPLRFEEKASLPGGDTRYFDTYKAPLFDKEGNIIGLLGVSRDITGRKRTEQERQRLTEQLMHAQKMEAIGTLAGGVAHDLNNILAGLVSYPELLLMNLEENSPLRKPLLTIQKSGERAASIVQDLLTLSRRGMSDAEVINLNHIVTEFMQSPTLEKLKLDHPEIMVEVRLDKDLLNVMGSPAHLSKTVLNLVLNAYEALERDGSITIKTRNCYVDTGIKGTHDVVEGEYVKLTVADTGKGIADEDLPRIFEPFYTKKVMGHSGSGLGLSVVWGIVQDQGGFIDVQSEKDQGTRFHVYWPVTRRTIVTPDARLPMEAYMGKGESILVVDDIALQREILSEMLYQLGYSATTVASGEEAVAYVKEHTVDLIVLDMILGPGMDGFDTYKKIIELHPGQKAIITSGFSETDRVRGAQKLGAGAYIKKPYLMEKIGPAIRDELDR